MTSSGKHQTTSGQNFNKTSGREHLPDLRTKLNCILKDKCDLKRKTEEDTNHEKIRS